MVCSDGTFHPQPIQTTMANHMSVVRIRFLQQRSKTSMHRMLKLFGAITLKALLLAACGGGTAATPTTAPAAAAHTAAPAAAAPTAAAEPTAAPAATAAAEPTAAETAPTAMAEPTAASTGGATAGPKVTGEVTLWHAYGAGSAEETAINQLIDKAKTDNPDAKITVLSVPFDQIFNKFETEAAAGGGPDMFIAPNDSLGKEVRADLLMAVDDQIKGGLKIAFNENSYHNVGFLTGFGGKIVDDTGKCALDPAFGEAMAYLKSLKDAGAEFFTDGGKANDAFQTGKVDAIINGPWATGDYKK